VPLNLSFTHIMVVLIVALIVLGPDKLPDAARSIAKVIRELRRMSTGLKDEVRETFGDFAEPFSDLVNAVAGGVADATSAPSPAPPQATPAAPLDELPLLGAPTGPFAPGPPPAPPATGPAPGTFMAGPGSEGTITIAPLGQPSSGPGNSSGPTG
jgi:Tat protein translocase TatB subunit